MQADILDRIVAGRRARIAVEGAAQGLELPAERPAELPIVPFPAPVICEIKRRSPSRGALAPGLDPVTQAQTYREYGARAVSVLTEQDHFDGALADLVAVKRAAPELAVLRKDFLVNEEDIGIAWRAGADAVLLIAAILTTEELAQLHAAAVAHGLAALVEIHDKEDLARIRPVQPPLVGINSRDLRTFRVDTLAPLALASEIDWPCTTVFESGVFYAEDALVARDGGFGAVLVGEAVVRDPSRIGALVAALGADPAGAASAGAPGTPSASGRPAARPFTGAPDASGAADASPTTRAFWSLLAARRAFLPPNRPLVKICGITCREDAELARDLGADLLGLVYADSPRRAPDGLAAELARDIGLPMVAVVVEPDSAAALAAATVTNGRITTDRAPTGEEATTAATSDTQRANASPATDRESINLVAFRRARADLAAGVIDALQLHGAADPEVALTAGWPYFKALRPATEAEAREQIGASRSPRLLVDAFHPTQPGGTGHTVTEDVLQAVITATGERPHGAVWLAGGLHAGNVAHVIERARPELIDASSRLESTPGRKDPDRMRAFFDAIDSAAASLPVKE